MSVNFAPFDEGEVTGYLDYQSSTKSATLGNTLKDYSFSFYAEDKPVKGYLLVITESPPDYVKWRLWLNNFSLTKEFKPNLSYVTDERKELHFHIFDVTHLLAKGKNELTVNYNSARPLTIRLANATMIVRSDGFFTRYSLRAGLLQLKPGEAMELKSMGRSYLVVRSNSRGKVKISNGKSQEDMLELGHECEEIDAEGDFVRILNSNEGQRTVTQILLHYSYASQTPRLDFDLIPELSGNNLQIRIVNKGDVDIERLTLIVMLNGVTVGFRTLNDLSRGGETECVIQIPAKKGLIYIRSVGMRAGLRKIVEKELKRETA
ncbi:MULTISPECIES: hypothetical protein [Metallosphaera]|uniref:Uncharacterized protein n=2 Tax=Metallosphaera sedula TaxID=43687 RepID=A4YI20_METS5|nr:MULTISPECIES: hypothetical protein [Metallosphaera]ABP96072.1 hypothetical protein Msed_1932 [Metallosphaera sedula DSM 5348]AIM28056.1 hypothetical protein HA72_1932 [Metallosphaera sedula]AKV74889.1 hypothetical protein MsedA_1982 [Metallosphaera sedula]AKV77126.1 hypothetical protein MsedB_1984 [Metallosphaera sedula]AKV79377.1 hypothetical protein MsedC_1982 [Metallosphaera sedula]